MGRMSIEEPVKVKTSEDNEKVLVTNSKRNGSNVLNTQSQHITNIYDSFFL